MQLNNSQALLCLAIAICAIILIFCPQKAVSAPAQDVKLWVAECSDQRGNVNTYRGTRSSFDWSYEYGYFSVTTSTHVIRYPAHACTLTSPR